MLANEQVPTSDLTKALSRLAGNRHSDGVSSIVSAGDRSVIINFCYEMMIALKTPSPRAQALEEDAINWRDKYNREVLGLNNEGDPIGGDPAYGLNHRIADLEQKLKAAEKVSEAAKELLAQNEFATKVRGGEGHLAKAMSSLRSALSSHPVSDKKSDEFVAYRFKHRNDGPHMWEYYPLPVEKTENPDFVTQALTLKKLLAILNSDQHADRQSQPVADGWLPIETVEKDVPILIFHHKENQWRGKIHIAYAHSDFNGHKHVITEDGQCGWIIHPKPTHWRPLPASPGASE